MKLMLVRDLPWTMSCHLGWFPCQRSVGKIWSIKQLMPLFLSHKFIQHWIAESSLSLSVKTNAKVLKPQKLHKQHCSAFSEFRRITHHSKDRNRLTSFVQINLYFDIWSQLRTCQCKRHSCYGIVSLLPQKTHPNGCWLLPATLSVTTYWDLQRYKQLGNAATFPRESLLKTSYAFFSWGVSEPLA